MAEAPKPTHFVSQPDCARRSHVSLRSYVMKYPSHLMDETFPIYSCQADDMYGMV